jgi:hypothetical protein
MSKDKATLLPIYSQIYDVHTLHKPKNNNFSNKTSKAIFKKKDNLVT